MKRDKSNKETDLLFTSIEKCQISSESHLINKCCWTTEPQNIIKKLFIKSKEFPQWYT